MANDWEICETIPADDPVAANRLALNALEGGAESLHFVFEKNARPELDTLLDGIFLEMVGLHFSENNDRLTAENFLLNLKVFLSSKNFDEKNLRGSMDFSGGTSNGAIEFSAATNGQFRTIGLTGNPKIAPSEQLAWLLKKAVSIIESKEKEGIAPEKTAQAIHFELPVGTDFLGETAKFRAFQILWMNIQKAWGHQKTERPFVHAVFAPEAVLANDADANFIRSTTLAIAAVIGGCTRLTVSPAGDDPIFHRRIARNVQHLLKLESGFDRVHDPAAGSFFIEKMTGEIVAEVWGRL